MKKSILPRTKTLVWSLVLVISSLFLLSESKVYPSELKAEEELNEIYSKILCVGCGEKKFIDHSEDCPVAQDLRNRVRSLVEKGFDKETIVWNFNGGNIAFIYQLPAEVIRELSCPCACNEKVWVCLASENRYSCPVIETVVKDIRELKEQGKSNGKIIKVLKSRRYQEKYSLIIEAAIKIAHQLRSYDISDIPDFVLDNAKCSCECTESIRTCIEKMPWCKRIGSTISMAKLYLHVMKLSPQDVVFAMHAPCGKMCGKRIEGKYLGENCSICQRPVLDKAYYIEGDGKKEVFCCQSCYEMGTPLPQAILDNVLCKVCPCKKTLRECNKMYCPLLSVEKRLIKTWLLQGMTQDEVIRKLK